MLSDIQSSSEGYPDAQLRGALEVAHSGLRISDLRKTFKSPEGDQIELLRGLSFSVAPGETVAIMGASGAGKSTLLQLIGGLEKADHGNIWMDEFCLERANDSVQASYRNEQLGFIFQFHHLLTDLTAAENVALPLLIARYNRSAAMKRALAILEKVNLTARATHPVGRLSGGEQQRVAVCRALINRPSLVLADEPTGNLDALISEEIGRFLVSYMHENFVVGVLATHNHSLARLCDRILLLRDGRLSESSPEDLK